MKKFLFLVVSFSLICLPCLAEGAEADIAFDLTHILSSAVSLLGAAFYALIVYAWKKFVKPWLVQTELMDVAEIVVGAAEAIMGRKNGDVKWELALSKLQEYGYNVDSEIVMDAVRAAWKQLDLSQIMAGEKDHPPEGEETPEE
jgi:hypothetical protein